MNRDPGEVKKRKSSEAAHAAPSNGSPVEDKSQPLVALVPAQKRSATDQAGGETWRPIKVREESGILRPIPRHAHQSWSADKNIRGRHSAPDQRALQSNGAELRSSKSAPDLRAPVLAAIQALKDGTIQVDERTRAKIAQAARRVLDARVACQRNCHDNDQHSGLEIAALRTVPDATPERNSGQRSLHQQAEVPALSSPLHLDQSEGHRIQIAQSEASPTHMTSPDLLNYELNVEPRAKSYPFTVTSGLPKFPHEFGLEESKISTPSQLAYERSRNIVLHGSMEQPGSQRRPDVSDRVNVPKD